MGTAVAKRKVLSKNPRLRLDAGLVYMTDPNGPSLEKLHSDARFSSVTLKTLERWCKEDQWVERRAAFFEKWQSVAKERLGSSLVKQRQAEYQDLLEIHRIGMDLVRDVALHPPKSWGEAAKIVIDAGRYARELEGQIAGEVLTGMSQARPIGGAEANLSPDELQLAAREILRHRREAMKLESGIAQTIDLPAKPAPEPIALADAPEEEDEEDDEIEDDEIEDDIVDDDVEDLHDPDPGPIDLDTPGGPSIG